MRGVRGRQPQKSVESSIDSRIGDEMKRDRDEERPNK